VKLSTKKIARWFFVIDITTKKQIKKNYQHQIPINSTLKGPIKNNN
jgi:hypothetical protein